MATVLLSQIAARNDSPTSPSQSKSYFDELYVLKLKPPITRKGELCPETI